MTTLGTRGFFFFSKEAQRSEKTGEGRSEKKKPLVAAGTNLTSMCTYFEIDCWLVSTIYLGCHWLNSSPRSKPVFLVAGSSDKQRKWQRLVERGFWVAVQYALNTGFTNILELKAVQEEALLNIIKREDVLAVLPNGCGKSSIFQLVPKSVHIWLIEV